MFLVICVSLFLGGLSYDALGRIGMRDHASFQREEPSGKEGPPPRKDLLRRTNQEGGPPQQ